MVCSTEPNEEQCNSDPSFRSGQCIFRDALCTSCRRIQEDIAGAVIVADAHVTGLSFHHAF
jgi:hypothetical protein